ncbi:MAG: hypothetical protein JSV34_00005, partial [Candidatus Omnitrophota bacterium]
MSKYAKARVKVGLIAATVGLLAVVYFSLFLFRSDTVILASPTDWTLIEDETWDGDFTLDGTLTIPAGITLTVDSSVPGTTITINVGNLVVEAGGNITATAKGFAGGAAQTDGTGTGAGAAGSATAGGGGAGYGAAGGDGGNNPGSGGTSYGSISEPIDLGSGGGGGDTAAGGAGGGAMHLIVSGALTL